MSSKQTTIRITKGLPIEMLFGLTNFRDPVDLNDGTWTTTLSLRHRTEDGPEPFPITGSAQGQSVFLQLTPAQTEQLDSIQNDYALVVKIDKDDNSVNIRNVYSARVVDDL